MSDLDKEHVITKFTQAYTAANSKAPQIEGKGGWYSVNGEKNVRLAQLDKMADELASGRYTTNSQSKTHSASADVSKASKVKTKKVTKSKHSTFSVKSMWAAQIEQKNPGSTQPR
ncbi:MAG: hypothetical protein ACI9C4_001749 [Paraglaciecola sp.]|jgi:hypothetical protein